MMDDNKSKESIRKELLDIRKNLSDSDVEEKSSRIVQQVINLTEFQTAGHIHCYVSMATKNEVKTREIIQFCIERDKIISVPKMEPDGELSHHSITSIQDLTMNNWGVPEPSTCSKVDLSEIELIMVPMVAGDLNKNRIGYGKGYYDRFLKKVEAVKIGLLFECQLLGNTIPVNAYDVPLDILVTEKRIIR